MKLKFNKEGKSEETLKAYEAMEKDVAIEGAITKEDVTAAIKEETKGFAYILDADNPESIVSTMKVVRERVDNLAADKKKANSAIKESGSFNDNLVEFILENKEAIKEATTKNGETRIGSLKAVGDMSIAANFLGSAGFITDFRNTLIENPNNRSYISDALLQGRTDKQWISYPKENGGEGGAAIWSDPTVDKAQMDFDFTSKTVYAHWNAGYVIVDREFLDDIPFAESLIRAKMLLSLKNSREAFVLNGVTVAADPAKSVQGLLGAATAYTMSAGITDNRVNRIIDSGYGQIVADTHGFYYPTHTVLHPRTSVAVGLNQATGSGEYDLPAGSVGFVNGKLNVGGIEVVNTTNTAFTQNDFLTFDRNAAMFITKMNPEFVVINDSVLAKRNKLMLRIEERISLAIFNEKAIVKGTLTA